MYPLRASSSSTCVKRVSTTTTLRTRSSAKACRSSPTRSRSYWKAFAPSAASSRTRSMPVASQQELVERIWERDSTVWTGADEDRWLGWLDEPKRMLQRVGEIVEFAEAARAAFDSFVLLGMGGSSLAPEVLKRTFGAKAFHVLDTTHPAMVRHAEQ